MSFQIKRSVYEAIEQYAAEHGGVGSNSVFFRSDPDKAPCCPWGVAMFTGAVQMGPYTSNQWDFEGWPEWLWHRYEEYNAVEAPLPDFLLLDAAVDTVRGRLGLPRYEPEELTSRVPWPMVAEVLGLEIVDG